MSQTNEPVVSLPTIIPITCPDLPILKCSQHTKSLNDFIGVLGQQDTTSEYFINIALQSDQRINIALQSDQRINIAKRSDQRINQGINVRQKNEVGSTFLHFVENAELAKYFIEQGVGVNDVNSYGYTPLMCAVMKGNAPLVKLLIDNDANIDILKCDNKNIEHACILQHDSTILLNSRAQVDFDEIVEPGCQMRFKKFVYDYCYDKIKKMTGKNLFELLDEIEQVPILNHLTMGEKLELIEVV